MDIREGAYLKHIPPEHFTEVYKRVQKSARDKYQRLLANVEKNEMFYRMYLEKIKKGEDTYDWENNAQELDTAKEYLERFIAANADYLI